MQNVFSPVMGGMHANWFIVNVKVVKRPVSFLYGSGVFLKLSNTDISLTTALYCLIVYK